MINTIRNLIKRVTVTKPPEDRGAFQAAQVSYMGRTQNSQIFHDYGFCSTVPRGGFGICLSPRGEENDRFAFVCHPKYRAKDLKPGETIVGNFVVEATLFFDEKGRGVLTLPDDLVITCKNLNADVKGNVTVKAAGAGTMEAAAWAFKGPVSMANGLAVTGAMSNNGTNVGSTHDHGAGAYRDAENRSIQGRSAKPA